MRISKLLSASVIVLGALLSVNLLVFSANKNQSRVDDSVGGRSAMDSDRTSSCGSCESSMTFRPVAGVSHCASLYWNALSGIGRDTQSADLSPIVEEILFADLSSTGCFDSDSEAFELLRVDAVAAIGRHLLYKSQHRSEEAGELYMLLAMSRYDSSPRVRIEGALWAIRAGVLQDPCAPIELLEFVFDVAEEPVFGASHPVRQRLAGLDGNSIVMDPLFVGER